MFGGLIDDGPYPAFATVVYLPGDEPADRGLFAEPVRLEDPAPANTRESVGVDARRTQRQRALIAKGEHPLTRLPLHPQAPADTGPQVRRPQPFTCGTCTHLLDLDYHNRRYLKCEIAGDTHCAASDCRRWWPACRQYEPRPDDKEI